MPHFTDLTGLSCVAIGMVAMLMQIPAFSHIPKVRLPFFLGAVFTLSLIPFGEMPMTSYLRGVTGDLSITTLVLLLSAPTTKALNQLLPRVSIEAPKYRALLLVVALTSAAFYPLALGLGMFDPYRIGYGNPFFIIALLMIVLLAWFNKYTLIVLCIALSTLAWSLSWYESDNLWDYLLDPFLATYALFTTARLLVQSFLNRNPFPNSKEQ